MQLKGYTLRGFDRGASRLKEAVWFATKCLVFETAWPWPSALKVSLLRAFGAEVGDGVVIRGKVNITYPWRLKVGDYVWIGEEVVLLSLAPITIESNVCISQRAFLCTGSHVFASAGFDLTVKPIVIRRGSWIAAQVFVAPGVEIGPDSMASAGAVVLRTVPPCTVVGGNPAVMLKEIVPISAQVANA
jgi:putative colanic acid biosynthesis acetyltransferase WcaF